MPRWCESLGFHEAMLGHQMGPKKSWSFWCCKPQKRKKYEKMRTYVNSYYYWTSGKWLLYPFFVIVWVFLHIYIYIYCENEIWHDQIWPYLRQLSGVDPFRPLNPKKSCQHKIWGCVEIWYLVYDMVHEWFLDGLADWKVTKKGYVSPEIRIDNHGLFRTCSVSRFFRICIYMHSLDYSRCIPAGRLSLTALIKVKEIDKKNIYQTTISQRYISHGPTNSVNK
jgi:hypothetical protein